MAINCILKKKKKLIEYIRQIHTFLKILLFPEDKKNISMAI